LVRLLLDTQLLVWVPTGDPRVSAAAREAMLDPDNELFTSAIAAFELADLQRRGRIAMSESLDTFAGALGLSVLDFPGEAWMACSRLPDIHRDPIDRMMIAHAMVGDLTLVTADETMRSYPVRSVW
jgi:PIN domain nuclease of toxin-antitoxin system